MKGRTAVLLALILWVPSTYGQGNPLARATDYEIADFAGARGGEGSSDCVRSEARVNAPSGIWGDDTSLYVADSANHTIRKIAIATGEVTTIAGAPGPAASVDGAGTTARFGFVEGLWG